MQQEMESQHSQSDNENSLTPEEQSQLIWKKNIPLYYTSFIGHTLKESSLTCQFLPETKKSPENLFIKQKILTATHNDSSENNYLFLSKVLTPNPEYKNLQLEKFKIVEKENSYLKPKQNAIEVEMRIMHPGQVNKARASYQSYNLIATKSDDSNVYIFDYTKHAFSQEEKEPGPLAVLIGNETEGWGLDWSIQSHFLASSDNDGKICIFDLEQQSPENTLTNSQGKKVYHMRSIFEHNYQAKEAAINEVKFNKFTQEIFGFSQDQFTVIVDRREGRQNDALRIHSSSSESYCLDFSCFNEHLILTGDKEGRVSAYDFRQADRELHVFQDQQPTVQRVEWSPIVPSLFAAADLNGKVRFYDCAKIQQGKELVFMNPGMGEPINDICWNYNYELGFMSVDAYCNLFVYEMD